MLLFNLRKDDGCAFKKPNLSFVSVNESSNFHILLRKHSQDCETQLLHKINLSTYFFDKVDDSSRHNLNPVVIRQ